MGMAEGRRDEIKLEGKRMEKVQNEVMETILHRRAIRRFEKEQIEEAKLQQILQAGLYAPSAGGRQGVLFVAARTGRLMNGLER